MTYHNNVKIKLKDEITLSREEYLRLRQQAQAYRKLTAKLFELPLKDPIGRVVADFAETNLYTKEFLADLEDGLRKSSYTKAICKSDR